jgi:hypothetical protein
MTSHRKGVSGLESVVVERRLLPINAWIALHKGEAGWPPRLREQGFAIHKFEVPITVDSGTVVVDATSVRTEPPAVVTAEAKGGGSIKNEQARRYAEIRPIHVRRHAGLPFDHAGAAYEVLYACTVEGRDGVRTDLDRLGLGFPLLVVGDTKVSLEPESSTVLAGFEEDVPGPPPRYITLDQHSSEDEFKEHLLPALIAAASRGEEFVAVETLLRNVLPYWDAYASSVKRELIRKGRDTLARAIRSSLSGNFAFEPKGSSADADVIRIVSSPVGFDPRGQTQSWQRLQRRTAKALGRPRRAESPGQAVLFEDLGMAVDQP